MKLSPSSFTTERKRINGLGAAKSGTQHFWHQRASAVVLLPLTLFFVVTLIMLSSASHAQAVATIRSPFFGLVLLSFILAGAYHMRLGMQVIIEDYVHAEGTKLVLLMFNTFFAAFIALAGAYALIRISLGS